MPTITLTATTHELSASVAWTDDEGRYWRTNAQRTADGLFDHSSDSPVVSSGGRPSEVSRLDPTFERQLLATMHSHLADVVTNRLGRTEHVDEVELLVIP